MNAKSWQQSYSGKVVTPYDLRVDQVSLADIGHALAQKIRFNGQCMVMGYTVAQHTVLGAQELLRQGEAAVTAMAFLLHEVSEVYLPDVPSPVKRLLHVDVTTPAELAEGRFITIPWTELESRHADAICEAIGLSNIRPHIDTAMVKTCDVRMLMTEKRDLLGPEPQPWGFKEEPYAFKISDIWEPVWAEDRWNAMFEALKGRLP